MVSVVFTLWSGLMRKHINISLDWAGSDSRSPEAGITHEDHCYWKSPASENRTQTLPVPSTFTQQILTDCGPRRELRQLVLDGWCNEGLCSFFINSDESSETEPKTTLD